MSMPLVAHKGRELASCKLWRFGAETKKFDRPPENGRRGEFGSKGPGPLKLSAGNLRHLNNFQLAECQRWTLLKIAEFSNFRRSYTRFYPILSLAIILVLEASYRQTYGPGIQQ